MKSLRTDTHPTAEAADLMQTVGFRPTEGQLIPGKNLRKAVTIQMFAERAINALKKLIGAGKINEFSGLSVRLNHSVVCWRITQ